MRKNFVEELKWRGMLAQIMPGTEELLQREMVTAYLAPTPLPTRSTSDISAVS